MGVETLELGLNSFEIEGGKCLQSRQPVILLVQLAPWNGIEVARDSPVSHPCH